MAIQDNSPTFSYVKIDGISVIWNNEIFMVQDFATNKKYVYWNADVPHQLNASNTMPNRSTVQHLVLINDNGISTIVPPTDENFSISFDGNSEQAIKEKILGLYAKNEEFGEKFVAIEQNIDGIKQIVGESGGSDSTLWEKVSQIEQKSDEISIAVKENKKEYDDNKETSQLREDLNTSIIQINSILGVFKSEITGYFKDNEIFQEESEKIKVQLELLENAKSDFDGSIDKVILIAEENGQSQDVIALSSAKQSLNNIHNNLKNNIENSIIDSIVTTTELTIVIDSFAKYNLKVNEIKNTCDNIIILGMGGVITEELARIDVKSDEIKLSVSKVESDFKNEMSLQKIEFEKQIGDVSSALNEFENTVNTVFKDGIVDEAEKQILMEKIANIDKEKIDVDSRFLAIVNDENLSEEIKADLIDKYDNFNTKYDNLKEKINQVISDDMVNDAEKLEVNTLFKQYANAISSFTASVNKAIENIAFNSSKAELEQTKNELKNEINDVKDSILGMEDMINGTFEDNILDEVERKNIEQNLETLSREKIDIDNIYINLYENEFLPNEDKLNLKKTYDEFELSYNEVVSVSNSILTKETLIDDEDKANLSKAIASYKDKLNLFFIQANLSSEIIANKKSDNLKNEFQQDLNDINNKVDDVLGNIDGAIVDGLIDEVEVKIIEESLNSLIKEKMDVDARYSVIYENENLDGQLKEDLFNAKVDFDNKIEIVITSISDMISDGSISEEEKENFDLAREEFNLSSVELSKKFEEAIDYISRKMVENAQSTLEKEINDLNGAISGLEDTMNGAFLDGVLSEAEKLSIKQHLLTLSSEKCDIDKQYVAINSSEYLDGEHKTNLVNSYNNYINSYNGLISTINTILEKNTIIDSIDRNNLDTAFENHNRDLGIYTECAIKALDYISQKKAEAESEKVDKKYAEIILDPETGIISKVEHINTKIDGEGGLEQRLQSAEEKITPDGISQTVMNSQFIKDMQTGITTNSQNISKIDQKADSISFEVSKKVGNDSIISAINQTAEAISISASKVNLNGYVTFSELGDYVTEDDLGKYGTTTIHGDRIETGSIKVNQLSSNNDNPIIKLFDNCSIDATSKNEQGKGNAIRLKMDNENYIKVTQSAYGVNGEYFGAHTAIFSSLYPNHEVMIFQGNQHWGKIWTTQGIISTHGNNVYYGNNGDTTDARLAKATEVDSVSTTANNALTKANSAYNLANHPHPYAPQESSKQFISGSLTPYSTDSYNVGWSSKRWSQCTAKYGYFTNTYALAIDNPVATISDNSIDNVIDDIIIESPNIMRMSDDNGLNEKLVINVNALKENKNAHLFVGKDDGGKTVVNESSLLALALLEIQKLKAEIKQIKGEI